MNDFFRKKSYPIGVFVLLIILTAIAYFNVFNARFLSWDDLDYVVTNSDIHQINGQSIHLWFSRFYIGNYHPLTMLSYALEYQFVGEKPMLYHITNMALHALNGYLVFGIISRLSRNRWIGLFTASLFVAHPIHAESVAWVAERKNVLYACFFLIAIRYYLLWRVTQARLHIVLVYVFGLLAMLSKATAVALPLSLIGIDAWQGALLGSRKEWAFKAPLFLMSSVFGLVAILAQQQGGFFNIHPQPDFLHVVCFAASAFWTYIGRLLAPVDLSVLYPMPNGLHIGHVLALLGIPLLTAACVLLYRKGERVFTGAILFYSVNIVFLLQLAPFGNVLTADRYAYIPSIPLIYAFVYYIYQVAARLQRQGWATGLMGGLCLLLSIYSYSRNSLWQSEISFWNDVSRQFPESALAQSSLAGAYLEEGRYETALRHAEQALKLDPTLARAWYNKGLIYERIGQSAPALRSLSQSLQYDDLPKARFARALLYRQMGNPAAALRDLDKYLQIETNNPHAHYLRGLCLDELGNPKLARAALDSAISKNQSDPMFFLERGLLHAQLGELQAAQRDMGEAISLNPHDGQAWYWRGILKSQLGQNPCPDLQQANQRQFPKAASALQKFCIAK